MNWFFWSLCCLVFCSCSPRLGDDYLNQYQYLGSIREFSKYYPQFTGKSDYYLVVLVDARHLDYSSPSNYFSTMANGLFWAQDPNTGHAWIVLAGKKDGKSYVFEGGHTGEFGIAAPKYFDEVKQIL